MANLIVEQAISRHPELSQQELIEILVNQIPNPQETQNFRQILIN